MRIRLPLAIVLGLAFCAVTYGQDSGSSQNSTPPAQNGGAYGQRGGRGMGGGMGRGMGPGMGMMGRGVTGTVTAIAPDHFTIKSFAGETYTVNYSANTRIVKMRAGMGGGRGRRSGMNGGGGMGRGGNPPEQIKASDIKVGDAIAARGEVDASAKSVGAVMIAQLDPEMAKRMEEMAASYGKTWLMGRVTAVDGVKVTLMGSEDNASHTFVANENTDFRERRNPITLADVKVGDMVRVDGSLQNGVFTAATVNLMRMAEGGPGRPGGPA
ncbi:MAG: DUF5666 domain-containing protein [Terracidiphilus sp.]